MVDSIDVLAWRFAAKTSDIPVTTMVWLRLGLIGSDLLEFQPYAKSLGSGAAHNSFLYTTYHYLIHLHLIF